VGACVASADPMWPFGESEEDQARRRKEEARQRARQRLAGGLIGGVLGAIAGLFLAAFNGKPELILALMLSGCFWGCFICW
jgi:hypothetical protein